MLASRFQIFSILIIGINNIKEEKNVYTIKVKEIPVDMYGQCYIIIPDQVFLRPYEDFLSILIAMRKKYTIQMEENFGPTSVSRT